MDADGSQMGVVSLEAALARAAEQGLDLVEISPMAKPPVCKIMDYGKFKYEMKKKANESKKKQVVVKVKEVKFRPKTDEHDYGFKLRNVREFLEEGNKARITIMFRGREITHKELGQAVLTRILQELKGVAIMEQSPRLEGRQLFMMIAPDPKWRAQREAAARKEQKPATSPAPAVAKPAPVVTTMPTSATPTAPPMAAPAAPMEQPKPTP